MAFSSLFFLFAFLPVFFAIYYAVPPRYKNACALSGSALFYFWGAPRFLPVVLLTSFVDYKIAAAIDAKKDSRLRRCLLAAAVLMNVSILLYFKYANFFVGELNDALLHRGLSPLPWIEIALPIGISFITFEKISYLVDVYTRRVKPAPNFTTYLLFLALFPHLIAGPIFRYHDVASQLLSRPFRIEDVRIGVERFILGLAKKVIIADTMAEVANTVFGLRSTDLTTGFAWIGALAYAFQIYFDFSGYSDMAIGLGRMMGFRFLENFDSPYISKSITEFWRRWHISLSNWMREYLYIPLGGNRGSVARTYLNLWIVFLISGFWHGANWTFLFWGFYHGSLLIIERVFLLNALKRVPAFLRNAWTFLLVLLGWIPFRCDTLHEAWDFVRRMFAPLFNLATIKGPLLVDVLNFRQATMLCIAILLSFLPQTNLWKTCKAKWSNAEGWSLVYGLRTPALLALFYLATLRLVNSHFHPFIYFRF